MKRGRFSEEQIVGSEKEHVGEHVGSLLRDSLDKLSISYTFVSGADAYKRGLLNEQIKLILNNPKLVGDKIKEFTGQDKYQTVFPYTPICKNCGRLYTTVVTSYDPVREVVHYKCDSAEIRDKVVKGCGYEGERSITEGEGKLVWKSEFVARWSALDIRFEAYGKDIADSVKVNDWIAENILKRPPPHHARYEMFQDKTGGKISKSVGNVLTPQEWSDVRLTRQPEAAHVQEDRRGEEPLGRGHTHLHGRVRRARGILLLKREGPERDEGREAEGSLRVHCSHEFAGPPWSSHPLQAAGRPGLHGPRREPTGVRHETVDTERSDSSCLPLIWLRGSRGRRTGRGM